MWLLGVFVDVPCCFKKIIWQCVKDTVWHQHWGKTYNNTKSGTQPVYHLNVAPHVVVVMVVIVVWLFRWCEADVFVHSENAPLKIGNDS
jgi:hypothetical protein